MVNGQLQLLAADFEEEYDNMNGKIMLLLVLLESYCTKALGSSRNISISTSPSETKLHFLGRLLCKSKNN